MKIAVCVKQIQNPEIQTSENLDPKQSSNETIRMKIYHAQNVGRDLIGRNKIPPDPFWCKPFPMGRKTENMQVLLMFFA